MKIRIPMPPTQFIQNIRNLSLGALLFVTISAQAQVCDTNFVADIRVGTSGSAPANFAVLGSELFFMANNGTTGN